MDTNQITVRFAGGFTTVYSGPEHRPTIVPCYDPAVEQPVVRYASKGA